MAPPRLVLPAVMLRSKVVLCTETREGSPTPSAATYKPPPAVVAELTPNHEPKMLSLALERATAARAADVADAAGVRDDVELEPACEKLIVLAAERRALTLRDVHGAAEVRAVPAELAIHRVQTRTRAHIDRAAVAGRGTHSL